MSELLTVGEARKFLGVKRFTFDTKCRPHLNVIKRGKGAVYFDLGELEEMRDNSAWEEDQEGTVVFKRSRTVKDALDHTWKQEWSRSKDPYRKESLKRVVEREIGATKLRDLDYKAMLDWIMQMREAGLKPATIKSRVYTLTYALKQVQPLGWIARLPDRPKLETVVGNERERWLSWEEEARLFKAVDTLERREAMHERDARVMRNVMRFLVRTGCRIGELVKTDHDWLNLKKGDETVTFKIRKVPGSTNVVPLSGDAKESILDLLDDPHWRGLVREARESHVRAREAQDWISYRFKKIRVQAGLGEDVVAHTLRHTCASRLVQNGMGIYQVKDWLGHKDIRNTMRYSHLAPSSLKGGLAAVTPPQEGENVVPFKKD